MRQLVCDVCWSTCEVLVKLPSALYGDQPQMCIPCVDKLEELWHKANGTERPEPINTE